MSMTIPSEPSVAVILPAYNEELTIEGWCSRHGGTRRKRDEYLRDVLVQSLGRYSAQVVPLALGSIVAMFFHFAGEKRFVASGAPDSGRWVASRAGDQV